MTHLNVSAHDNSKRAKSPEPPSYEPSDNEGWQDEDDHSLLDKLRLEPKEKKVKRNLAHAQKA